MAKEKTTAFFCTECGNEFSKWMGQCPSCKAWNTLVEEPVSKKSGKAGAARQSFGSAQSPVTLDEIDTGYPLCDGVLDLDPRLHLHEVELA